MDQAKVNLQLEDESSRSVQKRKQFFILVSTTLFIFIITSIISIFIVLKNHAENQSLAANSISAVQSACRATHHYYPACIESLKSQLNHSHRPIHTSGIIRLSTSAAFLEFDIINTLPQELASKVENEYAKPELTDCQTLFTDSLSQLNRSVVMISNIQVGPDKKIGAIDKDMIIYFIKRAKNNVDRCLDGLERRWSNGTMIRWKNVMRIKRLVKVRVDKAKIYMMNSLAILENKDVNVDEIFDPSTVGSILASFMLSREYFVLTILLLCLQYLVLVFLFCFLLRAFMSRSTRK